MALTDEQRAVLLMDIEKLVERIRSTSSPEESFQAIVTAAKNLTEADYGAILMRERGKDHLILVGAQGTSPDQLERLPKILVDEDFWRRFDSDKKAVVRRYRSLAEIPEVGRRLAELLDIGEVMTSSIVLMGEVLGQIAVGNKRGKAPFTEEAGRVLEWFSDNISFSIQYVRTMTQLMDERRATERILNLAPIGIVSLDAKGIFKSVNKQMLAILGFVSDEQLIGTSIFEIPAVNKSNLDALVIQAMEGTPAEKSDLRFVTASDKVHYLHVKATPVLTPGGNVEGVLIVAMDISSKVRLENQLERSYEKLTQTFQELERVDRMKSQFIDVVSHELRTPLTVMRGYIDLVESEYSEKMEPKFSQRLKVIRANTDKLYSLVESMLDVSRLEKGSLLIHPEPVKIDMILEDIVKTRASDAAEKQQTLSLTFETEIPLIMADRRRLKDVFNNLIDNAIKYTQEGGKIHVGARDEGKIIHVWVRDNGIGIPLENLGRIFDRFYIVASNDLAHPVNRIGLSLPISKGIIEAHGGRLWVESQVGRGSVFHVDLPKEQPK